MISIDTNILFHAYNHASPRHARALEWVGTVGKREDVVLSEFVLAEFYGLLRNPAVTEHPLAAPEAVRVINCYREHPVWRVVSFPEQQRLLHDRIWEMAGEKGFAFRRLFDIRTGISLRMQGVKEFATCNEKDFRDLGFERVWDPLSGAQYG